MILRITAGRATVTTPWGRSTLALPPILCICRWAGMRRKGKLPTGACSGRNWTKKRSTTYGWRSIRISLWAMHGFMPTLRQRPANGGSRSREAGHVPGETTPPRMTQVRESWRYESSFMQQKYASLAPLIAVHITLEIVMKYLLVLATLVASGTASAARLPCSIHAKTGASAATLQSLSKISIEQARATALSAVGAQSTAVAEGELEAEHGCLVYSFDIRLSPQATGVEEVMVDAGNGKVLSHKHETPQQEATEKAKDAAASHK